MHDTILNTAQKLFFRFGFRSVSMDDIARGCGISKKTLYQHFADRNTLVEAVVDALLERHAAEARQCRGNAANAVEEVWLGLHSPFALLAAVNYNFFHELEKYFPLLWEKVLAYGRNRMKPRIVANLERGIGEGLYEPGTDTAFAAEIRIQQLRTALNPAGFESGHSSSEALFGALTVFFLQAVSTQKGRKLISKYFNLEHGNATK